VPDLTNQQLTFALAIVAGVALIAFLVTLFLAMRLRRLRREYVILRGEGGDEKDLVGVVSRSVKQLGVMNQRIDEIVTGQQEQAAVGRFAMQRFHLIRYDAFEDMGGRLSFSCALLDDHGDGVVITSINGRTETRTYAKPVSNLTSEHNLSEEERQAITGAAAGEGRAQQRTAVTS
jgi:hypothetical protein